MALKELACQSRRCKRHGFDPWGRKILWRRKWQATPVFLPGESHGQTEELDSPKSWTRPRQLSTHCDDRLPPYDRHCIFSIFFLSTLFYSYFFLNLEAEHPTTLGILLVHEYNMSYLGYFLLVLLYVYFSVQFSHSVVSNSLRPHGWQHIRPPCPSSAPGVYTI